MTLRNHTNTIIIGASAAGLSCAVCLQQAGIPFILLEQSESIGHEWQKRYDRLHLHTTKKLSQLPYFKMPEYYPKYVSKDDFATYLQQYAAAFNIQPDFNKKVIRVFQRKRNWEVSTKTETFSCSHVIIATGLAQKPLHVLGSSIKNFKGEVMHSSEYTNGKPYKNKKVLVVGFGNSACEIALCLFEHSAIPSLSVRNGVNILHRDIAGVSIVDIALGSSLFFILIATKMDFPITSIRITLRS